jgi:hypothetical protein
VNNKNAIALKYTDLRPRAVRQGEQLPKAGQVRPKYIAIDMILILF